MIVGFKNQYPAHSVLQHEESCYLTAHKTTVVVYAKNRSAGACKVKFAHLQTFIKVNKNLICILD